MSVRRLGSLALALCTFSACSDDPPSEPVRNSVYEDITLIVPHIIIEQAAQQLGAYPRTIHIYSWRVGGGDYFADVPISGETDPTFTFEALCDADLTSAVFAVFVGMEKGHEECGEPLWEGQLPCSPEAYTIQWDGTVECWQP